MKTRSPLQIVREQFTEHTMYQHQLASLKRANKLPGAPDGAYEQAAWEITMAKIVNGGKSDDEFVYIDDCEEKELFGMKLLWTQFRKRN